MSILLNTVISFLRECSTALLWASSVVEQVEALHSSLVLEIRNKKYTFWNKVTFSVVINLGNTIHTALAHIAARVSPSFCSMKQLKELLLPTLLDRIFVHHRLPPPLLQHFIRFCCWLTCTQYHSESGERETERLLCARTRGSIPFFRNKFQGLFPRLFQDSDRFFQDFKFHASILTTWLPFSHR